VFVSLYENIAVALHPYAPCFLLVKNNVPL